MSEQDAHDGDVSTVGQDVTETEDGADAVADDEARTDGDASGDESEAAESSPGRDGANPGATDEGTDATDPERATDVDEAFAAVDEALIERVEESESATIAKELASLRTRIDGLESELDAKDAEVEELASKLKRKQADFQNYKKRMEKRREDEKRRAAEDLVTRLLDVRDNLARALDQDEDADIRGGVESTLRQFDDVFDQENVDVIEPEPGEDVDPHRHEVLVRVDSDQPEGTIADVHRPGYVMADAVLREAQVTVSDGE